VSALSASAFIEAAEERYADTPATRYARGDFSSPAPGSARYPYCGLCDAHDENDPLSCPRADVTSVRDCKECRRAGKRYERTGA